VNGVAKKRGKSINTRWVQKHRQANGTGRIYQRGTRREFARLKAGGGKKGEKKGLARGSSGGVIGEQRGEIQKQNLTEGGESKKKKNQKIRKKKKNKGSQRPEGRFTHTPWNRQDFKRGSPNSTGRDHMGKTKTKGTENRARKHIKW